MLPPGWIEQFDPATGRSFYAELATGKTQWEHPLWQRTRAPPPCPFATRVHMTARLEVGRALDPACSSVTAPPVAPEAEDRTKIVAEPAEAHKWIAKEFVEFKALAESSDALARRLAVC
jgi:hypothetical protein